MFGVHRILLLIPSNRRSNFFFFCSTKDKSSGSNSNNGSVINANTVFIPKIRSSRKFRVRLGASLAKSINQFSLSVTLHINNAVASVHTHITGFNRSINICTYTTAANDIIYLLQR